MPDDINKPNEITTLPGHGTAGRHPTPDSLKPRVFEVNDDPGMFGRMFPDLDPCLPSEAALQALATAMKDENHTDPAGDNPNIPAGFTYLGQFVDHDITLDLTSLGDKVSDPQAIDNFRTPALDLDSVYGLGPDGSRQLYARNGFGDNGKNPGPKLLIGRADASPDLLVAGTIIPEIRNDLPRNPEGFALIGDHRNDENLIVAQTHLAMLKFHNKVCDMVAGPGKSAGDVFKEARQKVTWHYQFMVLHDFVERLTQPGIVAKILHDGRRFYRFKKWPYMPVEFSAAAYRLGHSMVRQEYDYNRIFSPNGVIAANLDLLFHFTGLSGKLVGELMPNPVPPGPPPPPAPRLPSNWAIDWRRFYNFAPTANPAGVPLNPTRKIDPFVAPRLADLPGGGGSLPLRNLQRGKKLGLPSGQAVAELMGIANPLTPDEIASGTDGAVAKANGLHESTPLWYYILKEAEVRGQGQRLGPVGSTIVAEVFVGLVHGDHESYLWQKGTDWKPDLPSAKPGTFTMADLLRFVGDISPIDGISTLP